MALKKPGIATQAAREFVEEAKPALKAVREVKTEAKEPDVRLNANIAASLHTRLKMESVKTRKTIGEIVEDLIREHIPE